MKIANFTEPQIQGMLKALRDDMGYPVTRELAILELEAYKAKIKAQEEAKKKAEEEAQKATDADRANACRYLLKLFYKSKLTATEGGILDLVNNILYAKTKAEIWDEVAKTA